MCVGVSQLYALNGQCCTTEPRSALSLGREQKSKTGLSLYDSDQISCSKLSTSPHRLALLITSAAPARVHDIHRTANRKTNPYEEDLAETDTSVVISGDVTYYSRDV
jgi:hypothetical protein